ncbi:acriflavin resistance protein [Catenovulum agarivorans DS-2]|uniref:Acriflavin resistance protein n=1 Tax=Catenovulum agarivorans DS-2 TaxID=1328313 RepID=W7QAB8_9ALTE|nr:efflux RND transporter permease subunit [Catenovulum agarivorans]EWH08956.1 acriflavin resistance protein [Catenovulum agarivorans DS-2]
MNSIIAWFARNSVAANLLMLTIFIGGIYGVEEVEKEVFPATETNIVNINMAYLGAGPREVEQQIVTRIEEAIADLPGIFQIRSNAYNGSANVSVEIIEGYPIKDALADIKLRVDAINTFPGNTERPIISQQIYRVPLMFFTLSGNADDKLMKAKAQQIADEMALLEGVSTVNYTGTKSDEVSIELSEYQLRKYNLTFDQIAQAIRNASMNLPAGTIKSSVGNIQIQTRNQAYSAADFADIVVKSDNFGREIRLGDVAQVTDGFVEQDMSVKFNGVKAVDFQVMISDDPDLFAGTLNARNYLLDLQKNLPAGMQIDINYEMKELFDSRLVLLTDNALGGLILVFIILVLFLRPALALWVCVGIATAFAGAIWLLTYVDVTINMFSMFAFLVVLGIVVDDAIVVGEAIYAQQKNNSNNRLDAAIIGSQLVLKPVVLAVLTTIILFAPMLFVPMDVEPFTHSIFFVVTLSLIFSLVECLLILPAHLAHLKPEKTASFAPLAKLQNSRQKFADKMEHFAQNTYGKKLTSMVQQSSATLMAFIMACALSVATYIGGWLNTTFFPNIPQTFISVNVGLPEGAPYSEAVRIANHIEQVVQELSKDEEFLAQNDQIPFVTEIKTNVVTGNANVFVGLEIPERNVIPVHEVSAKLQDMIGPLPEAKSYSLAFSFGGNQSDIFLNMNIAANDLASQQAAVDDVSKVLASYPGVHNVRSSLESEKVEVELSLKPHAETLGIDLAMIARQVRQAIYGEEVQRIPRGKEDVRVMLKFPESHRRSLEEIFSMRIRNPQGYQVPIETVADVKLIPGFSQIDRVDRRRNIAITADIQEGFDANATVEQMLQDYLPQWQLKHIGINLSTDGNLRAQQAFTQGLQTNLMIALAIAYALMAIVFRSYWEPLLVLTAVPFGFMGAVWGHLLLGLDISMMSFFGFLACAGVVVNDNLVLLSRLKDLIAQGVEVKQAVVQAGVDRFRAIVLTSLTTFVGLLPILFEKSNQAQFLIPMVVALSFGVLFASVVTLIFVPTLYWQSYKTHVWLKGLFKKLITIFSNQPQQQELERQ